MEDFDKIGILMNAVVDHNWRVHELPDAGAIGYYIADIRKLL